MQALILAGGKGTRLRPLTVYTPKPIVPLMNRPFLLYQIETLKKAGINDIILSLNYQPDKIEQILGDGSNFGVKLRYITEPNPMGTAGAFRFAAESIHTTTVVLNGDILTDLVLSEALEFHQKKQADATIVLSKVENPTAYGLVETDEKDRVLRFLEKPKIEDLDKISTRSINAGTYILEPKLLDLIPEGESCSFEYDVFPALLKRQEKFYAFVPENCYWLDIGTPKRYFQAHKDFFENKIKGFSAADNNRSDSDISHTSEISENSMIAKDCTIKSNVKIFNSVIGQGVFIEEKVTIENSVIWAHTRISSGSHISDSTIGRSCHIGRNCLVTNGAVLGDKTLLTDYTQV